MPTAAYLYARVKNSLQNQVVVITGASSGIGKACAIAFAAAGCKVMLAARDEKKLAETKLLVEQTGGEAAICKTDVSVEADCKRLMEETIRRFGSVHLLVNNAGISMRALFTELDLKVLRQLMDINFWGTVYCTKYAINEILKNKGSIIGVSSIAGYQGLPGRTGYSASKFAMNGFLSALRVENLKKGLHVMIVCPGYTSSNIRNTALDKEGKRQGDSPLDESQLMTAEAVAAEIVNGAIQRKRTLILTTQGKLTVLLGKFFPSFIDRKAYELVSKEKDSPF